MRKLFRAAIGVALISIVFAGCKKEEEATKYMVQVTATEGGSVEGRNGEYEKGEAAVFKAIPNEGCCFVQWSDGSTVNPHYFKVESDITIEAQFSHYPHITVTADINGSVSGPENGNYAPDESLTFTATPSDGYYFSKWSDGRTENPRTITVRTSDITLTAEFAIIETVDLGLESGNIWTTCNVGAANPWDYGNYYAWGETETKSDYSWNNYKYGAGEGLTKYVYSNDEYRYGSADYKIELEPADDAATATFSVGYSTPTTDDWEELYSQCYWVWTGNYNNQNVSGYIVYRAKTNSYKGKRTSSRKVRIMEEYSLADKHIFLPAAPTDNIATVESRVDYTNPANAEWVQLSDSCCWLWTDNYNNQDVRGYIVYWPKAKRDQGVIVDWETIRIWEQHSLSDTHIFLPAAGHRSGSDLADADSIGYYWSNTNVEHVPEIAWGLCFNGDEESVKTTGERFEGFSVRPVRHKK